MKLARKIPEILRKPHPLNLFIVRNLFGSMAFGIFIFSFLTIFKPFGLQVYSGRDLMALTLGYGLVTTGYLFIHLFIIFLFLRENDWTVWKEIINILVIVAMIGLCNYMYHSIYFSRAFSLTALIKIQLETIAVSFIPIILITCNR